MPAYVLSNNTVACMKKQLSGKVLSLKPTYFSLLFPNFGEGLLISCTAFVEVRNESIRIQKSSFTTLLCKRWMTLLIKRKRGFFLFPGITLPCKHVHLS